ncbi:MAG: hypothetical protein IJ910_07730 [Bacteroidaceae bacterium]|nr:hypothetical protein [Bacteroidaceae bacterium]
MGSYKQIIKDERFWCRLTVQKKKYRDKSIKRQNDEFGLLDVYVIFSNEYLGSLSLFWDKNRLNQISEGDNNDHFVHRITVSTLKPMIHIWTYEDYRKHLCAINDIGKIELLPSGAPRIYNQISFLVLEIIDNETYRWEGREGNIEETFLKWERYCYRSIDGSY